MLSPPYSQGTEATGSLQVQIKASPGGQLGTAGSFSEHLLCSCGSPRRFTFVCTHRAQRGQSCHHPTSVRPSCMAPWESLALQCPPLALTSRVSPSPMQWFHFEKVRLPAPTGTRRDFAFCLLYAVSQSWVTSINPPPPPRFFEPALVPTILCEDSQVGHPCCCWR